MNVLYYYYYGKNDYEKEFQLIFKKYICYLKVQFSRK